MKKICIECQESFIGRKDKKYCSDTCRTSYNNRINAISNTMIKDINQILKKNRKILELLNPEGKAKVHKKVLLDKGFNLSYFTNIYTTKKGSIYYFCYDYGYLEIQGDYFSLVKRQSYVV